MRKFPDVIGTRDASPLPQSRLENLPLYPAEAAKQKIAGKLLLSVNVDAHGRPTAVEVERAEPVGVFDAAAKDAIMKWRFERRLEDGKPIAGRVRVPIEFAQPTSSTQS